MPSPRRRRAGKAGLAGAATREDRAFDAGDATSYPAAAARGTFWKPGTALLGPGPGSFALPGSPREMRLVNSLEQAKAWLCFPLLG